METVYIETTVVSYLTSRPSRNLIAAARQRQTWDWWEKHRQGYALFVSNLVIAEARKGDSFRSKERLNYLRGIDSLAINSECLELTGNLLGNSLIPENAEDDALHIAIGCCHSIDFLLTWNFKHLANAHLIPKILKFVEGSGYSFPQICTPNELMGE